MRRALLAAALCLAACDDETSDGAPADAAPADAAVADAARATDVLPADDLGAPEDASAAPDAAAPDAAASDALAPDASDASDAPDALAPDALAPDALAPDAAGPKPDDLAGELFLQETASQGRFGPPITQTEVVGWIRAYREPPLPRPSLAEVEGCRLFDTSQGADPGAFLSVDAGPIAVRGGETAFVLERDPLSGNYEAREVPLDLWRPGQTLTLSAEGDDVGGFALQAPAPDDVALEVPTPETGLSRAEPVLRWPPGAPGETIGLRVNVRGGGVGWEILCDVPDVGEATLPAAVVEWIPGDVAEVGLQITRRVTRAALTRPPSARLTVHLDARFGVSRVPVLP
jgi:hypothetical protein